MSHPIIPVPDPDNPTRPFTEKEIKEYIRHALLMKYQAERAAVQGSAKSFDARGKVEEAVLKRYNQVREYLHGNLPGGLD